MRQFHKKSENFIVGDGDITCLKRMRGRWFMKRGHWYECTLSGECGVVRMDSMNIHETICIVMK